MLQSIHRVMTKYPDGSTVIRVAYTIANGTAVAVREVVATMIGDRMAIWPTPEAQHPMTCAQWAQSEIIHAMEPAAFKAGTSDWQQWGDQLYAQFRDQHSELQTSIQESTLAIDHVLHLLSVTDERH